MTSDLDTGKQSSPIPLLTTKLNMPPRRANLVQRPRLEQSLEDGLKRKLTLISAPAGFGKTTLLSDWFHQNETPVVWLSLDRNDNDLTHYLTHLITGLQEIDATIGKAILSELQTPQPPPANTIMTNLVNDIGSLAQDFALVLDDYHFIDAHRVHGVVEFLLDHMPPMMHLFIATRSDPPVPMARMRSNDQLTELRAGDMSFTADEVEVFLNRMMELKLSKSEVSLLETRCEGWIAGLQLAALSLKGRGDVSTFINKFAGDDRHIADYLIEEVLSIQPDATQSFLLKTSILDRMTGSLCDSVTGRRDGESVLDELEKANLFLVPLDNNRRWYRYHHLFADLLCQRLPRLKDCSIPDLHQKASQWFEQNKFTNEAIHHAVKAQDFDRVAGLIEKASHTILMKQGETNTILSWLKAIPYEVIRSRPKLNVAYAWALFYELKIDEIEPRLTDAERAMHTEPDNDALAEVDTIRATVAILKGSSSQAIELFQKATGRLSEANVAMRGIVSLGLGYARMVGGDLSEANHNLDEAVAVNEAAGNISIAIKAAIFLAYVRIVQGRLHQATEALQQVFQLAGRWDLLNAPVMVSAFTGLAELARERNDLLAAAQDASKAVELSKRSGDPLRMWHAYIVLSNVKRAQGVVKGAIEILKKANEIIGSTTSMPLARTRTESCRMRTLLAQNSSDRDVRRIQGIMHWVNTFDLEDDWLERSGAIILPGQGCEFEHLTLARGLIETHELERALELLAGLRDKAEKAGRLREVIENDVLQAVALHMQDRTEQAESALKRALSTAEPEGFVRIFVDAGPLLVEVLETIIDGKEKDRSQTQTEFSRGYVKKLLLAFKAKARTEPDKILVEPLSEREVEVLQLLAARMSNQEIAEQLFISLNTVKTHIKNIISKLGVHNRKQAVSQARELGLL
jgi:LuxR family maltose regulon positive regulatory protein